MRSSRLKQEKCTNCVAVSTNDGNKKNISRLGEAECSGTFPRIAEAKMSDMAEEDLFHCM